MVEQLSEALAVVCCIDPDAYAASTYHCDVIDMLYFERVIFIVQVGTLVATATINFQVYESIAGVVAPNSFVAMNPVKVITQLDQAGVNDSNTQAVLEVKADELTPGYRYLQARLQVGVAGADAGLLGLGDTARWKPANVYDLASVREIVA